MNLEALLANLFTWMKVFNVCSRCMRHVVPDFDAVLVHFQFECVPDFQGCKVWAPFCPWALCLFIDEPVWLLMIYRL